MQLFSHDFVFSNQPRHRLSRHALFWLVVWLHFTLLYGVFPAYFFLSQGDDKATAILKGGFVAAVEAILYMPSHMTFAYGIIYFLIPKFLYKDRYIAMIIGIIGLIFLCGVISYFINITLVSDFRDRMGTQRGGPASFVYLLMAGMRGGTTIGGFAAAIKLIKVWYLKQQAYRAIEREKLQAELQLLKSQVHPHFLFNTLNNLYSLTLHQSKQSPEVVLKLSDLLRYMLYECDATEVALAKEVAFLKNYIGLEQLRYGDRLDMSVTISGDWQNKHIAPLLLVPFVENAFKHGTSEQLEQAWMSLDLNVQGNHLKFKLINSIDPEGHVAEQMGGIGLQNVRKRLELLYPDRHELRIMAEEETFMVILTLELTATPIVLNTELTEVAYTE